MVPRRWMVKVNGGKVFVEKYEGDEIVFRFTAVYMDENELFVFIPMKGGYVVIKGLDGRKGWGNFLEYKAIKVTGSHTPCNILVSEFLANEEEHYDNPNILVQQKEYGIRWDANYTFADVWNEKYVVEIKREEIGFNEIRLVES